MWLLLAGIRSLLRGLRRGDATNDDMEAELRHRTDLRAFESLRFSVLDLKLGGRMLVKHPALTAIATIAVAFAIAVGTVGFEIARQIALGIGVGAILALGLANNDLSDVHLDDFGRSAVFALSTILCCALAC